MWGEVIEFKIDVPIYTTIYATLQMLFLVLSCNGSLITQLPYRVGTINIPILGDEETKAQSKVTCQILQAVKRRNLVLTSGIQL